LAFPRFFLILALAMPHEVLKQSVKIAVVRYANSCYVFNCLPVVNLFSSGSYFLLLSVSHSACWCPEH